MWISHYSYYLKRPRGGLAYGTPVYWYMYIFCGSTIILIFYHFILLEPYSYLCNHTEWFNNCMLIKKNVESGDGRDYWDYEADNNVIEVWLSCAQGATLLWNSFNGNQYQWDFYWKPLFSCSSDTSVGIVPKPNSIFYLKKHHT